MLLGAVILVGQVGAHNLRDILTSGETGALANIQPDAVGTATHFAEAMSRAPILEVIEFLNQSRKKQVEKSLLQHADDLDSTCEKSTFVGRSRPTKLTSRCSRRHILFYSEALFLLSVLGSVFDSNMCGVIFSKIKTPGEALPKIQ